MKNLLHYLVVIALVALLCGMGVLACSKGGGGDSGGGCTAAGQCATTEFGSDCCNQSPLPVSDTTCPTIGTTAATGHRCQ